MIFVLYNISISSQLLLNNNKIVYMSQYTHVKNIGQLIGGEWFELLRKEERD